MAEQGSGPVEREEKPYGFLGVFERSVDAKGRLSLPFPFRTSDTPAQEEWALAPGPDGTLCLNPRQDWVRKMSREMRQSLDTVRRDQLRTLSEQSFPVRPDGQGRITLPLDVLTRHEITDTVAVVGMNHYLELWNPERLAAKRTSKTPTSDELLNDLYS